MLKSDVVQNDQEELQIAQASQARTKDYFSLLKPRVMFLVVFTAVVGLFMAPEYLDPILCVVAVLCIAVGGGGASALNMWYDADIDAIMQRTRARPIPAGLISGEAALSFGLILSILSVFIMGVFINWFAAGFLAFTIFFYSVVYTIWLKRLTPQNVVVGGAAGAFPPMIGWAAMTGSASFKGFILFLIIFLWTPPHFWALSLFITEDYAQAEIPMMPNIRGELSTKRQICVYTVLTACAGIVPWWINLGSWIYGLVAFFLGSFFVFWSWRLWCAEIQEKTILIARKLFLFSLFYLTMLFFSLLLDRFLFKIYDFRNG